MEVKEESVTFVELVDIAVERDTLIVHLMLLVLHMKDIIRAFVVKAEVGIS